MYYEGAGVYLFYKEDGSAIELNETDLNNLLEESIPILSENLQKQVKRIDRYKKKIQDSKLNIIKKRKYYRKEKYVKLFKKKYTKEQTREDIYKEVAKELSVSKETVKKHCKSLN